MQHLLDALSERFRRTNLIIVKRRLPNLKKIFSTLSFGERGQNTSDTVSDVSAGAIVLPMKVVHPSFQTKVIYTKSSGSSLLFHPTACKTLNQITMLLHLICQFMNWTSSMCQTFLFKSGYLVWRLIVQSCLNLIFQEGKETDVLFFPEITQNFLLRQVEFCIAWLKRSYNN